MQLVFLGEVLDGFQSDQVKRQLGQLLKIDDARLEKLFSGKRAVLKRSVKPGDAHRYVARLAQIGARVRIEPNETQGTGSPSSARTTPESGFSVPVPLAPSTLAPAVTTGRVASSASGFGFSGRIGRSHVIAGSLVGAFALLLLIFVLARPSLPEFPTAASLPSAEARAAFDGEYAAAPMHKVFAASVGGAWGWQGGAASLEIAFDKAIANCEARREPHMPHCAPLNINGQWVAREGG